MKKYALIGNPNSGKTTLFNELTNSYHHVGNWPGVTVEKKEGKLKGHKEINVVDLPGIYSLSPYTLEEVVTRKFLVEERPDLIINIVDASNIKRNLYLTSQLLEMNIPMVIAVNMMDVINKRGDIIEIEEIAQKLNVKVIPISAVTNKGVNELIKVCVSQQEIPSGLRYDKKIESALVAVEQATGETKLNRFCLVKVLEQDETMIEELKLSQEQISNCAKITVALEDEDDIETIMTRQRYHSIDGVVSGSVTRKQQGLTTSDKIDKIMTNKWLALPIFFGIMWFIYYVSIQTVGDMTIGYVEELFGAFQGLANDFLVGLSASEPVISFVTNGIIGSIGSIFIYVPQLMILFLFLSILEDSGYMARVAFIMDRLFRKFGLSGKSFIPMLIGTGCSIPGIMAARTIENESDRKLTILLTPFIPCGAKLPVFAMFIAIMFPNDAWVGPVIYLIALLGVIISGVVLKRTKRFSSHPSPFVMELPEYKFPRIKGVVLHMWEKGKSFVIRAGTIIFVACAILWALQSFTPSFQYISDGSIDQSILASIGNSIKWIFIPLGFGDNWAAAVASVTGLIAKEVVVATFASVSGATDVLFSQVTAFSFMIFTIFAAPCFAAIGAMRREYGNWKDTLFAVGYQTGLAYVLAMLVNVIGSFLLKGTSAVDKVVLDAGLMEAASEGSVINVDIVLVAFGLVLVSAIALRLYSFIKKR